MMDRRAFLGLVPALALASPTRRRVAVTMDDANWAAIPEGYSDSVLPRLLDALGGSQAALFVVGRNVDNAGGEKLLSSWSGAGHLVANHTYGHEPLYRIPPEAFIASIERNELLLAHYPTVRKWFRFPQLKEGRTREVRDQVRAYLDRRGYRNGHVTIDTSDWYYDERLRHRLEQDPEFPVSRFREPYVEHVLDRARFYDRLSQDVLGRSVSHTLLVHYNLLNALFLGDVLETLEADGWETIDADVAYDDAVFRERVDALPAGESLIWSLAHATGRFQDRLRYPGEDGEYEKARLDELGL